MSGNNEARAPFLGSQWLLALGLAVIVFGAAALGSLRYSGLINEMGEWQFRRLGFYLPMLSIFAWLALVMLVTAAVGLVLRRKAAAQDSLEQPLPSVLSLRNGLLVVAFLSGLVALGGAINLILLPSSKGLERVVTPTTLGPGVEGNARLQGFRVAGPMARYSEGVLFWKQDIFLVPLAPAGTGEDAQIRVFAQVTKYEAASKVPGVHRGLLRNAALPGELYPLYAGQGVSVQENAPVLFRTSYAMALPTLLVIGEAATVAIAALLVALLVHRRRPRTSA